MDSGNQEPDIEIGGPWCWRCHGVGGHGKVVTALALHI